MHNNNIILDKFYENAFDLKTHLANYLKISIKQVEDKLPFASQDLASIHPGSINPEDATIFYEDKVGHAHLFDLAAWHLTSRDYIADTLRLQSMFAKGNLLDFGGGIGTHSLAAAQLPQVDHVWFVDLNPDNREFVKERANELGLESRFSFHRDLSCVEGVKFDTLICLDVLEHIPDPSAQLVTFQQNLSKEGIALLNWYFFKGFKGEFPFHFDDKEMIENFFITLQDKFIEIFHPYLITARVYKVNL
tara:strand:+ start:249 stop:992 length:744 start_codon:yes stop_codon:yes gene_type:complete